jgi:hypothetical protein
MSHAHGWRGGAQAPHEHITRLVGCHGPGSRSWTALPSSHSWTLTAEPVSPWV